MADKQIIPLAMSPMMRKMYFAVAIFSIFFGLAAVGPLNETKDTKESALLLAGIGFFVGGGCFILYLVKKDAGRMEMTPECLVLDSYAVAGVIDWNNVEKIHTVRILGMRYLGIRVRDLGKLIASAEDPRLTRLRERMLSRGIMGVLFAVKKFMPLDIVLPLLGWPKLPDTCTEEDLYAYNAKAWGYHVLIQSFWLPEVDRTVATLQAAQSQYKAKPSSEPEVAEAEEASDDAQWKQCPMCAERIRVAAAVCRFCRYSFETRTFAA